MSATFATKFTDVTVDTDDAGIDGDKDYFGYIAVNFNAMNDDDHFFMETFDIEIVDRLKSFLKTVPNLMVDKDIRHEDMSITINLPSVRSKIYATDVVRIVKQAEEDFLKRKNT